MSNAAHNFSLSDSIVKQIALLEAEVKEHEASIRRQRDVIKNLKQMLKDQRKSASKKNTDRISTKSGVAAAVALHDFAVGSNPPAATAAGGGGGGGGGNHNATLTGRDYHLARWNAAGTGRQYSAKKHRALEKTFQMCHQRLPPFKKTERQSPVHKKRSVEEHQQQERTETLNSLSVSSSSSSSSTAAIVDTSPLPIALETDGIAIKRPKLSHDPKATTTTAPSIGRRGDADAVATFCPVKKGSVLPVQANSDVNTNKNKNKNLSSSTSSGSSSFSTYSAQGSSSVVHEVTPASAITTSSIRDSNTSTTGSSAALPSSSKIKVKNDSASSDNKTTLNTVPVGKYQLVDIKQEQKQDSEPKQPAAKGIANRVHTSIPSVVQVVTSAAAPAVVPDCNTNATAATMAKPKTNSTKGSDSGLGGSSSSSSSSRKDTVVVKSNRNYFTSGQYSTHVIATLCQTKVTTLHSRLQVALDMHQALALSGADATTTINASSTTAAAVSSGVAVTAGERRTDTCKIEADACVATTKQQVLDFLDKHGGRDLLCTWLVKTTDLLLKAKQQNKANVSTNTTSTTNTGNITNNFNKISQLLEALVIVLDKAVWTPATVSENRFDKMLKTVYKEYTHQEDSFSQSLSSRIKGMWSTYYDMRKGHETGLKANAIKN